MSKQLRDADIESVVKILDGWNGKLTWAALLEAVWKRLYTRYTRQALDRHDRIKQAFTARKKDLRGALAGSVKVVSSPELQKALERIGALEAANKRLERESRQLLEQFVRWAHNAKTKGLDSNFLNRPLPKIDRGKTEERD